MFSQWEGVGVSTGAQIAASMIIALSMTLEWMPARIANTNGTDRKWQIATIMSMLVDLAASTKPKESANAFADVTETSATIARTGLKVWGSASTATIGETEITIDSR